MPYKGDRGISHLIFLPFDIDKFKLIKVHRYQKNKPLFDGSLVAQVCPSVSVLLVYIVYGRLHDHFKLLTC